MQDLTLHNGMQDGHIKSCNLQETQSPESIQTLYELALASCKPDESDPIWDEQLHFQAAGGPFSSAEAPIGCCIQVMVAELENATECGTSKGCGGPGTFCIGRLAQPPSEQPTSGLVARAHAHGLGVHTYTHRNEVSWSASRCGLQVSDGHADVAEVTLMESGVGL